LQASYYSPLRIEIFVGNNVVMKTHDSVCGPDDGVHGIGGHGGIGLLSPWVLSPSVFVVNLNQVPATEDRGRLHPSSRCAGFCGDSVRGLVTVWVDGGWLETHERRRRRRKLSWEAVPGAGEGARRERWTWRRLGSGDPLCNFFPDLLFSLGSFARCSIAG
jgi:hypothetical protein